MTQLGERFREAREARGISILEASTATRILPRYLQAIEAGDVASLPGDVYARGFIRNYAQLLGLPAEEMVALYRQERGEPTGRIKIVPAAVPPQTRSCLIPSFFVTFFTVLLLLAALYAALRATGLLTSQEVVSGSQPTVVPATPTTFPTPTDAPEGATQSPLPPVATTVVVGAGVTPNPLTTPGPGDTTGASTPAAPSATTPPVAPTAAVPVFVQATVLTTPPSQGSWFTVNVDGAPDFNALLRPGQSRSWQAQREVFLNIGDTSVVQLLVNGQPVPGLPGAVAGVPRRLTCGPQGCQ